MITFKKQLQHLNAQEWLGKLDESTEDCLKYSRGDVLITSTSHRATKICIIGKATRLRRLGNEDNGYIIKGSDNVTPKVNSKLWMTFITHQMLDIQGYRLSLHAKLKRL